MATINFDRTDTLNGNVKPIYSTSSNLTSSDDTSVINLGGYTKAKIYAITSGYDSGDITITAEESADNSNFVTLDSAETITADGTVLVGTSQPLDISVSQYVRVKRGGDSNGGEVKIVVILGN